MAAEAIRYVTPETLSKLVIGPVVAHLNWPQPREREVLLCAIAIQESKLKYRRQMPRGPAMSFWQIEGKTANDCVGRCTPVRDFCKGWVGVSGFSNPGSLGEYAIRYNDAVACAIAAGILRLHPSLLPEVGDEDGAWRTYVGAWRPGKPRPNSWPDAYKQAMSVRDE